MDDFKCLLTTLENNNSIERGNKSRCISGNACYHSVQNLMASRFSFNIKIHRTMNFPVVVYGCEIWSLIFREECRLRVYENMAFVILFGSKRGEVTGEWIKLLKL